MRTGSAALRVVALDRRKQPRKTVAWPASIIHRPGDSLGCVVLNISLGGARLRLSVGEPLPSHFLLEIADMGSLPVELLEQAQRQIRVRFLQDARAVQRLLNGRLPL